MAYRLYLPQEWSNDRDRLRKVGVPEDIGFQTKHEIALEQLRWASEAGLPRGVVLTDAGYGNNSELRTNITVLELTYIAGILSPLLTGAGRPEVRGADEPGGILTALVTTGGRRSSFGFTVKATGLRIVLFGVGSDARSASKSGPSSRTASHCID